MNAMSPSIRKAALSAHIASSIGWFGAVAAFMALTVVGLYRVDAQQVRAAYIAMELIGWLAIVPLALVSLLTGVVSSVGTGWGLIRHYWVVVKLLSTALITVLLLVHMQPVTLLANAAATQGVIRMDLGGLKIQMLAYAAGTLIVLLALTALSVYKPAGMTRYGWRKQFEERAS